MRLYTVIRFMTPVLTAGALASCGSSAELPVGGPSGSTIPQSAVLDAGFLGDASGVLPIMIPIPQAIGGTPTWTQLFNTYMASNTIGNCNQCHAPYGLTPSSLYQWLQEGNYLQNLASEESSTLIWFGGTMPPSSPPVPGAMSDFSSWSMAGRQNN